MTAMSILCAVLAAVSVAFAHQLSFESASVEPGQKGPAFIVVENSDLRRVTYRNYPLKRLIADAYGVADYQVRGPDWLAIERYTSSMSSLREQRRSRLA
jgi:uncharacterized protein (TIGR03435 family)